MKISQPSSTSFNAYETRPARLTAPGALKIGQVLQAVVLANSQQGQVKLRLANRELIASTPVALQRATPLAVQVMQIQPQLLLKVLPATNHNPLQDALVKLLPKQSSIARVLAELVARQPAGSERSTTSSQQAAVSSLLAAIPQRKDLRQADGLQRAISRSGLFLEARLAAASRDSAGPGRHGSHADTGYRSDLKAQLSRLSASIDGKLADTSRVQEPVRPPTSTQRGAEMTATRSDTGARQPLPPQPPYRAQALSPTPVATRLSVPGAETASAQGSSGGGSGATSGTAGNTAGRHTPLSAARAYQAAASSGALTATTPRQPTTGQATAAVTAILTGTPVGQAQDIAPPLRGMLPARHPVIMTMQSPATEAVLDDLPALLSKLQGALARLGLLQRATAECFQEGQQCWQLELPVRHGNTIETVALTIEKEARESGSDEAATATWSVNLALELPNLGTLQSRISMDRLGVSTLFWSESRATLALIDSKLDALRSNLAQHGLDTHKLGCIAGQQPAPHSSDSETSLIDCQI